VKVAVLCPPNTRTPGLDEENKYKPAAVLKTEEKAKPVNPDQVANELLKCMTKNDFMIVPTFDGRMAYSLSRFAPGILGRFVKRPSAEV
jgi:3-dehydrosphinganine reductase